MTDDLYARYQQAAATWRTHRETCAACRSEQHCPTGAPLYRRLAELQDAYHARQSNRQR
ncbi:hypothetical protein ACFV8T_39365 [Streptomyces sp. NPDC059832]|uniref:hypothetical protein n=1 Tax=unclassified Streptomyces TaxID=2593676 RepID=UPI003653A0E0